VRGVACSAMHPGPTAPNPLPPGVRPSISLRQAAGWSLWMIDIFNANRGASLQGAAGPAILQGQASSGARGRASPQKVQDPAWVYDSTCDAQTNLALELVTPVAACVGCAPPWAARALITEASRAGCHLPTRGKRKGGLLGIQTDQILPMEGLDLLINSSTSAGWGMIPLQDLSQTAA
jgi:hypothetical protein